MFSRSLPKLLILTKGFYFNTSKTPIEHNMFFSTFLLKRVYQSFQLFAKLQDFTTLSPHTHTRTRTHTHSNSTHAHSFPQERESRLGTLYRKTNRWPVCFLAQRKQVTVRSSPSPFADFDFLLFVVADFQEITSKFTRNRNQLPAIFVATPKDQFISHWTKEGPTKQVCGDLLSSAWVLLMFSS